MQLAENRFSQQVVIQFKLHDEIFEFLIPIQGPKCHKILLHNQVHVGVQSEYYIMCRYMDVLV